MLLRILFVCLRLRHVLLLLAFYHVLILSRLLCQHLDRQYKTSHGEFVTWLQTSLLRSVRVSQRFWPILLQAFLGMMYSMTFVIVCSSCHHLCQKAMFFVCLFVDSIKLSI